MENNVQTACWLIGESIENLQKDNLPMHRDVIIRFLHKLTNTSISMQASTVADEISIIWQKFGICHQEKRNKLHDTYRKLKKIISRKTEKTSKREVFLQDGWKLFDIRPGLNIEKTEDPSKLWFLEQPRNINAFNIRSLRSMDESNPTLAINDKPPTSRSQETNINIIISDTSSLTLSSSASEYQAPVEKKLKQTKNFVSSYSLLHMKNVIDKNIVGALDRSKISNSRHAVLIATTANALRHDLDSIAVSKELKRRHRQRLRKEIREEIFKLFSSDSILMKNVRIYSRENNG